MRRLSQRLAGAALCAWLLSACTTDPSVAGASADIIRSQPIAKIPYRVDYQGWITVDAYVNGAGPYDFIVDSGATITAVFANLSSDQPFRQLDRAPIRIVGLTGARALPAYHLGDISIASLGLDDHVGVILPDWAPPHTPPQGVLGLDFLTRHKTLVSRDDRTIRLYAPDATPDMSFTRWGEAPLEPVYFETDSNPLYRVNVLVRGARIPCIVDLGASGSIFNSAALRRMLGGLFINGTRREGFTTGTRLHDVFDNRERAVSVRIRRLSIGRAYWRNVTIIVHDAAIFEELGVEKKPYCLIGADMFANRSFMLDFENQRLLVGPPPRRS